MTGRAPSKVRPSREPTAQEYEAAIQKCEDTYKKNKSRMWVLVILREMIAQEVDGRIEE